MLFNLLAPFGDDFGLFNLFRYLTFRTGGAVLTALVISFVVGPPLIRWLRAKQGEGQPIREDGPQTHLAKKGTPTMGGALILLAISFSTLLWADLANGYVWAVLLVTLGFGAIGVLDDLRQAHQALQRWHFREDEAGLPGRDRAARRLFGSPSSPASRKGTGLAFPFFKNFLLPLGWAFFLFAALVMMGTSNAVNLTDGLDGLAIVPTMIAAGCFLVIAYLVGNARYAPLSRHHLRARHRRACDLLRRAGGGGARFLWFNAPPAMVFMGDTGSLATGGAIGTVASSPSMSWCC